LVHPVACAYEFLRVVTHPRVFDPPTPLDAALDGLESLLESPSLTMIGEGPVHASHMLTAVAGGQAVGNLAHDAHIAALVIEHGARELWTTDRDFSRFPGLSVLNPFADDAVHDTRARYGKRKRPSPARSA
jgi:hypothetical protein